MNKKIIILVLIVICAGAILYLIYKKNSIPEKYTIEQLQDIRRIDGVVEPVYTQDCFPKTLHQNGVTKDCFERANLGQNDYCTQSEIELIQEYYKNGQENDPLNDGSGQFCAEENNKNNNLLL